MRLRRAHHQYRINWFANLRVAPLLAAIFLCAQILATAHNAAYADVDHVHDGVPCIVVAASKQSDTMDEATPVPSLERNTVCHLDAAVSQSPAKNIVASTHAIRGPPIFS